MSWLQQLGGLLQQYAGMGPQQAPPEVHEHYQQVARNAPPQALADGFASAFRSNETPPFPEMVSQLFGQAQPQQQAGLLNTLLGAVGPQLGQQLLGGLFGGGGLGPQQAAQVPPQEVQRIATQAEQRNPGVIDAVSGFLGQHPELFGSLGGGALATAMGGMAQRQDAGGYLPASQDPYGDPADQYGGQFAGQQVLPSSQDPYGDPADMMDGQQVLPASEDPYGDPADQQPAGGW
jgi:hypothetical protein